MIVETNETQFSNVCLSFNQTLVVKQKSVESKRKFVKGKAFCKVKSSVSNFLRELLLDSS